LITRKYEFAQAGFNSPESMGEYSRLPASFVLISEQKRNNMKKTILTYGLISGAVSAVLMVLMALSIHNTNNFDNGEWYGYAGMVISFMFVYVGIRRFRDQENQGQISFGKAFQIGLLIALISSVCYVVAWLFVYYTIMPDFMEKYAQYALDKMRTGGASEALIQQKSAEMEHYKTLYKNPITIAAVTFMEPLPVGLLMSLLSAFILRRKA
jgi:hypothetical protein